LCQEVELKLTSLSEVKRLLESYNLAPQKKFGQNFLTDEHIVKRIASECTFDSDCGIIEIGPGLGTLSVELADIYKKVLAVEIDESLLPVLGETTSEYDNFEVICSDILKVDLKEIVDKYFNGSKVAVCANLPYYITTPILMYLLSSGVKFESITVMIQKEVADRLVALPGKKEYGAITVAINRYGTVKKLFNVPAGCFHPKPNVDSAVIMIVPHKERMYVECDENILSRTIHAAFGQRRKTLQNALNSEFSSLSKSDIEDIIVESGFRADIRGEKLSINDFAVLSLKISEKLNK